MQPFSSEERRAILGAHERATADELDELDRLRSAFVNTHPSDEAARADLEAQWDRTVESRFPRLLEVLRELRAK